MLSSLAFNFNLRRSTMGISAQFGGKNFCHDVRVIRLARHGRAMQVDPIKHTLKVPGTKRLKPKYDEMLSSFAFKFNIRRYSIMNGFLTPCSFPRRHISPWEYATNERHAAARMRRTAGVRQMQSCDGADENGTRCKLWRSTR